MPRSESEEALFDQLWSTLLTPALHVVAHLGIADQLKEGPKHVSELAKKSECDEEGLYRVLRALASREIFAETSQPREFKLTPKADALRSDHPRSLRAVAIYFGEPWRWETSCQLLESIRSGQPAFTARHQQPLFEYLKTTPNAAQVFDEAMVSFSAGVDDMVADCFDFSPFAILVDIGGGYGGLLKSILNQHPKGQGILFDLAHVVESAKKLLQEETSLNARITFQVGCFFESKLPSADAYLMKSIIHDWDSTRAIQILQNCRRTINPNGRVLVCERVIPPGNEPFDAKLTDLEMLLMTPGGRERNRSEYESLFRQSGFEIETVVPTPSTRSLIVGRPV